MALSKESTSSQEQEKGTYRQIKEIQARFDFPDLSGIKAGIDAAVCRFPDVDSREEQNGEDYYRSFTTPYCRTSVAAAAA